MRTLMSEQVPVEPIMYDKQTVPPYSSHASADASRRYLIVNYMPYADKKDGQWIIRQEHKQRFVPFKEVNTAFESFVKAYISIEDIGLKDIGKVPITDAELWLCLHSPQYLPKLVYHGDTNEFRITKGSENCFTPRDAIRILAEFERLQKPYEELMHCIADGRTRDSGGGTYVSGTVSSIIDVLKTFHDSKEFRKYREDYPHNPIALLDYGAGFNRPAIIAAVLYGWRCHGIEICMERVLTACRFYKDYLSDTKYKNIDVVLHLVQEAVPLNLSGFSIVMLWDKVRLLLSFLE